MNATDRATALGRERIDSPCIGICVLDAKSKLCTGCLRSGDEIAAWTRLTPDVRQAIMAELPVRAGRLRS